MDRNEQEDCAIASALQKQYLSTKGGTAEFAWLPAQNSVPLFCAATSTSGTKQLYDPSWGLVRYVIRQRACKNLATAPIEHTIPVLVKSLVRRAGQTGQHPFHSCLQVLLHSTRLYLHGHYLPVTGSQIILTCFSCKFFLSNLWRS